MKNTIQLAEAVDRRSNMSEAVDPQVFGELRSLLAAPYKGVKSRKTFLRTVADRVSVMLRDAKQDQDAVDTIITYADDMLGQISNQELLVLQPIDAETTVNQGLAKAQRLEPAAVELMRKHHLALVTSGSAALNVTPPENTASWLKLNFGSVKQDGPNDAFALTTTGAELEDRDDEAQQIIAAVGRHHKRLHLWVAGSVTFSSVDHVLKKLAGITPSTSDLVAEVKVSGWQTARQRSGLDPIPALMARLETPRNRIDGTNGRLTVILTFDGGYVMDGSDAEELEAAVEAGIIRSFGEAYYQSSVSITFN